MKEFLVRSAARDVGIHHPVVAVYRNVEFKAPDTFTEYDPLVADLMSRISTIRASVLTTPHIQGYRALFTNLGYPKLTPAGERLLGSFETRGFRRYGNFVDACNLVGLENVEGLGMHDVSSIGPDTPLIFKRSDGTERMVPAFKDKEKVLKRGDLTYGVERDGAFVPFAWLGQNDADNRDFQLRDSTTAILLTAIGNANTTQEHNVDVCTRIFKILQMTCPNATMDIHVGLFVD